MSNRTFENINLSEMDQFLRGHGFSPVKIEGTHEVVYGKRMDSVGGRPATMRVYTSITDGGGVCRAVGSDAIRVAMFYKDNDGDVHMFGSDKRVNRITTWKKNLQKRLDKWTEIGDAPTCPRCGAPTILRKGTYGDFYGCATWHKTKCSGKVNVFQYSQTLA